MEERTSRPRAASATSPPFPAATDKRRCSEASWERGSASEIKNTMICTRKRHKYLISKNETILSDLGGVQEAYWDESEIQAALLDELVLHLEIRFRIKRQNIV